MRDNAIVVHAFWDEEAGVWVATSDDVPGLVTEAETQDELLAKLHVLIPELIELNGDGFDGLPEVPLVVMSEQTSKVRIKA